MPVCFQLCRKSDMEAGPVKFVQIDFELCSHFGVEPDEKYYYMGWYDTIGFNLACGNSFDEIKAKYTEYMNQSPKAEYKADWARLLEINDYLDTHFTPDSWWEPKSP